VADTAALLDTLYEYAAAVDDSDAELMAACFTEDAVIETEIADGTQVPRLVGRQAIVDFITRERGRQRDRRRHLVTNPRVVDQGDDRAVVVSYVVVTSSVDGVPHVRCTGSYRDEFVLDEGRWRIRHKRIDLDSSY
jgi:3-phenylpropionate/cinnamic acid dioxygenase small subunit